MLNFLKRASTADLLTTCFGALSAAAEAIHEGPNIFDEPWKAASLASFAVFAYFSNHSCERMRDKSQR